MKISVIGGGFSSLAAASVLAKSGHEVHLFEKNDQLGGRCRTFEAKGFIFDMGPSWYWMPDVFERFFQLFNHTTSDFYQLKRLDPSYQIIYPDGEIVKIPADYDELRELFERIEQGSADKLDAFLADAQYKYDVGVGEFVHKPSLSIFEYIRPAIVKQAIGLNLFGSISKAIRSKFKNEKLRQMLEFPVLFLGAKPSETPALYSLMNYADIKLGTWYPMGGMVQISKALGEIAAEQGVHIHLDSSVGEIKIRKNLVSHLKIEDSFIPSDYVISGADYHHTETSLLAHEYRSYTEKYWENRVMAPSSLLFYIGVNKRVKGLLHHNLFFDTSFDKHSYEIYDRPSWPDSPLFYVCCPSITDQEVAPEGCENIFILIPLAAGIKDKTEEHERLFRQVLERIKTRIGEDIEPHIMFKRSYCHDNFVEDYNSFKGNAYGLANTLLQTAFMKPSIQSKKIRNLFYTGQLTTPGPGMPPSLISGEVVAKYLLSRM